MVTRLALQRTQKDVVVKRRVKKNASYLDNSVVDYQGKEGTLFDASSVKDDISSIK
jgi:hypothetical protein